MILNFDFYKTEEGQWFIDLPSWDGEIEELEMVAGADTMLDLYSKGQSRINLSISTTHYSNFDKLTKIQCEDCPGAFYEIESFDGRFPKMEVWLCDVVKFIFNRFPDNLYVRKNKQ